MYLSGCGDGYANTAGTYVGGAMVGSLFIGTYDSGIIQGHDLVLVQLRCLFGINISPIILMLSRLLCL